MTQKTSELARVLRNRSRRCPLCATSDSCAPKAGRFKDEVHVQRHLSGWNAGEIRGMANAHFERTVIGRGGYGAARMALPERVG